MNDTNDTRDTSETLTAAERADRLFLLAEQRAWKYFDGGDWENAERAYRVLSRYRPHEARYRAMLGVTEVRNGRPATGARHLEEALKLRPDYPEAKLHLAEATCLLGRLDEGVIAFRELYEEGLDPDAPPEEQSMVVKRAGANLAAMLLARDLGEAVSDGRPLDSQIGTL